MIHALVIPADTAAPIELRHVEPTLEWFQETVGGYIEEMKGPRPAALKAGTVGWMALVNEEGAILGLPLNRRASRLSERFGGRVPIVGTAVFIGPPNGQGDASNCPDWLFMQAARDAERMRR